MKKLIFANLKMYQNTKKEIDNYLNELNSEKLNFIAIPPIIYLDRFIQRGFTCGVQNISVYEEGAHTGETSVLSIKDMGCKYVLVGHSEIRNNETDEMINIKIKIILKNNLIPILCIGESLEAYNQKQTKEILKKQIQNALKDTNEKVIISYEPVWAIGTGKTPTNEEIIDIINYIKSLFNYDITVLYGGSVSLENIETLNKINNVNGFLIGKAATNPSSLKKIIEVARM